MGGGARRTADCTAIVTSRPDRLKYSMISVPTLILAAGCGRRLSPLTDELPKCLLPIGGISPLEQMLTSLARLKEISEVSIVVGHAHRRIASFLESQKLPFPVRQIFNPQFDAANNIYSADLGREWCQGGFLLINSDVLFHPRILEIALEPPAESLLVVDPTLPPRDEAMRVRFTRSRLTAIAKNLDPKTCDGEYIGIAHFDSSGAAAFFTHVRKILAEGGAGEWYEAAIARAAKEVPIGRRSTQGLPWIEIDDPADLDRAAREVLPRLRGVLKK